MIAALAVLILLLSASALVPVSWRVALSGPWGGRLAATAGGAVVATGLVLCRYTHPCLDDFCTNQILQEHGWWWVQRHTYQHWSGRFTCVAIACTLGSIQRTLYRLTCMGMLLSLLCSVRFCAGGCSVPRAQAWTLSLVLIGLWLATMPSFAEGLCWESGLLNYQSGLILDLVLLGIALRQPGRERWLGAAVVGLACAGCPETTVGLLGGALGLGIVLSWGTDRVAGWLIAAGALGLGFLVSAAAPGNHERARALRGLGEVHLTGHLALEIPIYPLQQGWYAIGHVAILAAAMGCGLWGWRHAELLPWRRWLLYLAAAWLSIVGGAAPSLIFYGSVPGRADNTVHLAVMLGVFVAAAGVGARLRGHQAWLQQAAAARGRVLAGIVLLILAMAALQAWHDEDMLLMCISVMAVACLLAACRWHAPGVVADGRALTVGMALACCVGCYFDLGTVREDLRLRLPEWNRQLTLREDYLQRPQTRALAHVRVPAVDSDLVPMTVAVGDITPAPDDWVNTAYAFGFGLHDIGIQSRLVWDEATHLPVLAPLPAAGRLPGSDGRAHAAEAAGR